MRIEPRAVAKLIYDTSPDWHDAKIIVTGIAIVWGESDGVTNSRNINKDGSGDYGLWQINTVHKIPISQCYDPEAATHVAYLLWRDANRSFSPWAAYNNQTYKRHLKLAARGLGNFVAESFGLTPVPLLYFPPQ